MSRYETCHLTQVPCSEYPQQYDHKLVDIKYDNDGVTAIFANGNKAKGTLIVGCDGPKSAVRSLLLGEERAAVTPLDIAHANTAFCLNDAEKAKYLRSFHPGMTLLYACWLCTLANILQCGQCACTRTASPFGQVST